jgi:2-keto-3-deoxy-L-rhamnonate aldolase RhmA
MKPNALQKRLGEGKPAYGTMIQISRNPAVAQIMAMAGCNFVIFDMEHNPYNLETVADMVRVARLSGVTPLVRVPDPEYHLMCHPLDLGAQGIMVPRVEARAQVEHMVECICFPPLGRRGCSVNKGHNDFESQDLWEFTEQANRENLLILQIELRQAVERIDELLDVEGVDGVIIGPNDLALSMGVRGEDLLDRLEQPIQHVLDACLTVGIPCGIHIANLQWLGEWQRRGMQLLCYSTDIHFLRDGAATGILWLKERAWSVEP